LKYETDNSFPSTLVSIDLVAIAPIAKPRRFPHELEILIEIWGVDRNEISPSAWVAAPASDEWDLLNRLRCLNCMVAWDRLLGSTVADRRWPTWFEFGEASA
jgi:hypothetical protein